MEKSIHLAKKFDLFEQPWTPKVVAELNDYQFKIAWFEDEFVWHQHSDTDEAFFVIEGHIKIHLRDKVIDVREGELYCVPKGVEHKPEAVLRSKVLMLEPRESSTLATMSKPRIDIQKMMSGSNLRDFVF